MFELTSQPIDSETLKKQLLSPSCGACSIFEGWVRNNNNGQAVTALEYEAYAELCLKEAEKIFEETKERFKINQALCVHRLGHLAIGDLAVWVGVSALHRDSAFQACRYVIDEIKKRLPIWKKEFTVNGDCGWVNREDRCHSSPDLLPRH